MRKPSRCSNICSQFANSFKSADGIGRRLIPAAILVVFSLGGAAIFYVIENGGPCQYDFYHSWYFVNTVYTTIGYGNVYPCTAGGKGFTVVFALIGIPLTLVVLDSIGTILAEGTGYCWSGLKNCRRRCKRQNQAFKKTKIVAVVVDPAANQTKKIDVLPLTLGFLLTVLWIFASALYFFIIQQYNWHFGDCLYFVLISFTTIGFGDYFPTDCKLTAVHFAFIFVGISLFSMCINIVSMKISNIGYAVGERIKLEYREALERGDGGMLDGDPGKIVREKIKKRPGGFFLEKLMSKLELDNLTSEYEKLSRMRSKELGTDNIFEERQTQTNEGSTNESISATKDSSYTQTIKSVHPKGWW